VIKPKKLNKGDKVAVITLSRGLLGMPFIKHELELGIKRLKEFGLEPVIMPNSLNDMDHVFNHPEERAADLKQAFLDDEIKCIITAIGGDDTYKTIPYLMEDEEFIDAVKKHPKIFTGFSDTTNNHLMFSKIGLETFYGPCFLVDLAELDNEMLPYTKDTFSKFFMNEDSYEIKSSPVWYNDRESFAEDQLGIPRKANDEINGYEVLNGSGKVTGKLYGGCIDSLYDIYTSSRYGNENEIYTKYNILPTLDEWKEKVLFVETSEEKMTPDTLEMILNYFKDNKILESVKGIIVGKPIDETYYNEYKDVYKRVFSNLNTPVLYNVNFGHSVPRTLLPYGATTTVDYDNKTITIDEPIFDK
jgi:muramoyltetrapeptide carboxypeptidase LdcA involved in peptidoglycan recycling